MGNIQDHFDDAKCSQTIRDLRRPDGVTCPRCSSASVIKTKTGQIPWDEFLRPEKLYRLPAARVVHSVMSSAAKS